MSVPRRFLAKLERHTRLTADEQNAVLRLDGANDAVPRESEFVRRGADLNSCSFIVSGLVARAGYTAWGKRQIMAFYVPGDMPDLHALMMPHATASLLAVTDASVLRIPTAALREVMVQYPAVAEALWRETAIDASIANEWVMNIGQRSAKERIAHLICEMAQRLVNSPSGKFDFAFPASQGDLADATGMSPVHDNRVLQTLRKENVVQMNRQKATVYDWNTLQNIAGFDPSYFRPQETHRLAAR
jgi:CRP-like cAMP-binding protein